MVEVTNIRLGYFRILGIGLFFGGMYSCRTDFVIGFLQSFLLLQFDLVICICLAAFFLRSTVFSAMESWLGYPVQGLNDMPDVQYTWPTYQNVQLPSNG